MPCNAPMMVCSGNCVDPTSDGANCGTCGHDCLGGMCTASVCQPVQLVGDLNGASYLAQDADTLYWTNFGGGTVMSIPKAGGTATTLATGQIEPLGISVNATSVYWANYGSTTVQQVYLNGTNLTTVAMGQTAPAATALDATHLYWANYAGTPSVFKANLDGTNPVVLAMSQGGASCLVVDATAVYWVDYVDGAVRRVNLDGTNLLTLAMGQAAPNFCALDATNFYWTSSGSSTTATGTVNQIVKDGSTPAIAIATSQALPSGIAVDGSTIFWLNEHASTVVSAPVGGGASTVLAMTGHDPINVVVDAKGIYWTVYGMGGTGGGVWALAR